MPFRGWKSCGALLSLRPMSLRCSWRPRCLVVFECCFWMPIMPVIPMIPMMSLHVKSCEILWKPLSWIWFGCFETLSALFLPSFMFRTCIQGGTLVGIWGYLGCLWLPWQRLDAGWRKPGQRMSKGCVMPCHFTYFAHLRRPSQLHLGSDTDHATACCDWHPEAKSNGTQKCQMMSKHVKALYLQRAHPRGIVLLIASHFWSSQIIRVPMQT